MEIIRIIALVLISMVGYSAGAMFAGGNKNVSPTFLDVIVILVMWGIALATRGGIGNKWLAIGIWVIIGVAIGSIVVGFRRHIYPDERINTKTHITNHGWKGFWEGWKAFGKRLGNYQSRILLAFFYFPIVIPFGIIARLVQDPFQRKIHQPESRWMVRAKSDHKLESIQRQF